MNGVRDEFLNLDFPCVAQIIEHSNRPLMADISRQILEPMYQSFLVIHADAIWNPETKSAEERRFLREKTRVYLELAGKLSDILIQHGRLAADLRVPAPRVAWLLSVMRADQLYGFSGDEVRIRRVILRGKMASLYQYSERLQQRAADCSASEDDALAQGAAQMAGMSESEDISGQDPFFVTRTVAQAIVIPPLLYVVLDNFRSAEVNRDDYCGSPQGEVAYARNFLRPFAHVIRSCIPSTVCGPDDMPFGRAAELEKYVLVYIERAALLYAISFEAVTFDYFLGRPTYGYVPGARDSFLSRISMAANLANKARGPSSALDVPLTPDFASLPQVPSWSRSRIASLESLELINSWACENTLLEDGIEQTQNVGRALEKSVMHADMGYAPNPSGRYFVPARLRSAKRLSRPELVILWIHRARHLAQGLHHTTNIATEEETPHETVGLIRDAVSVLLKNMVALGKASLKYGAIEGGDAPEYFVPSQGTTLFGMAEHFVDLYGYHGDGSPFDRALMFDNLNTLFRAMVLDEEYLQCGVDFPNFELAPVDLERYGIYEFIKPRQIARVHAEDPRIVRHQFGDRLLRYNPRLDEAARYTFPDPSQEYAATRPNTPVPSLIADIPDGMGEDGEESDKENESP
ncbi:hypothetical protein B0H14DRAFT_3444250 [Mycena olivaceomarginata]|nr:hypothetical protein B0H14DRAFT_3444250 [Mycena olivaceomarginata]